MPLLEFRCRDCETKFEELVRSGESVACPKCGGARADRLLSAFAVTSHAGGGETPCGMPGSCATASDAPCSRGGCRFN